MRVADRTSSLSAASRPVRLAALAAVCLAVAGGPALAQRAVPRPCAAELGRPGAAALVDQCRQVSLATRPPCNAENSCRLVRDEIRRGCGLLGAEAPAFCRSYVEVDEDDEEEDG